MKITFQIYFLLFILIPSSANSQSKKQILEFENVLGKENYITLSKLTSGFEKDILTKTYPTLSIENAYEKFLIDVKENKANFWHKISSKNRKTFKKSDLRLEIYEFPDSVWLGKYTIESRYVYNNKDGTIEYGFSSKSADTNLNSDSLIEKEYDIPRLNYTGKYLKAIKTIKDENKFLESFYEVKDTAGYIHSYIMAEILLKSNPDFSNPITKGLIVIEFGY